MVDAHPAPIQGFDGVDDKVDEVIDGHPVAQVGGQEQRRVVVEVDEAWTHVDPIALPRQTFKQSLENRLGVSPTGC